MSAKIQQSNINHSSCMSIDKLFDDVRTHLVDTGTRNRLIHVNRSNTKGNVLNISGVHADHVYSNLADRRTLRFIPTAHDREGVADSISPVALGDPIEHGARAGLPVKFGPHALQKKLLKIAREAQTAEEESGVNILYLVIGFLTWFEDKASSMPREAPLVLLPAELVRNARTSTYDLRLREDEILTNLPLQQRLREDFGIELPMLEFDEGWTPGTYLAAVSAVVSGRERWRIDSDAIQLGFFSFSKLLMYRDLAVDAWPNGSLATHALTRSLLYEGFPADRSMFSTGDRLDKVLPPDKLFHVIDADASQAKVIEEVRSGHNLVVQGPPGTGKSQTIANIVATAVRDGKRVLFLAEKMTALSVVHERLVKVGLRDICLELHSRSANKKAVLGELARTIGQAGAVPKTPGAPTALKSTRDRLNELEEVLHRPIGDTGETPFLALGRQARFIGKKCPPPKLKAGGLESMPRALEAQLLDAIQQYGTLLAEDGSNRHPFEGVRNYGLQPVDLVRLESMLEVARLDAAALGRAMDEPLIAMGITKSPTIALADPLQDLLSRIEDLPIGQTEVARSMVAEVHLARLVTTLRAGVSWQTSWQSASAMFVDVAFDAPVSHLRGPLAAGVASLFARWGRAYRAASRDLAGMLRDILPRAASARLQLVEDLTAVIAGRTRWEEDAPHCAAVLGEAWCGQRTDFATLLATAAWCERLCQSTLLGETNLVLALAERPGEVTRMRRVMAAAASKALASVGEAMCLLNIDQDFLGDGGLEHVTLETLAARLGSMVTATDRYATWAQLRRLDATLTDAGLGALVARMRLGELDTASAMTELSFARAEMLWGRALAQSPVLRSSVTERRHALVAQFATLDRQHLTENVIALRAGHLAQIPQGAQGEMGVIRSEIAKKMRHLALRQLFERAGRAVQRIKPVLLMSPVSVAQYLPPGALSFDLLVIDEASQVRPEDALGAVARANQIVVVGDDKQLPPSSFFGRLVAEDDDADFAADESQLFLGGAAKAGELESVLSLCAARGLSSRMLTWHYRSRDPSLIAVSNREFYDSALVLPPSPLEKDPTYGLCFTRVDGVYDKGGRRNNPKEADAIVARVAAHAHTAPTLSLGIVTFSFTQRNTITDLLEVARRSDASLDHFLREGQAEDVFVRNIENVQGYERDVILVSVGYGPVVAGGRLTSMSFGPVNGEGGERRLNVLFTRARVRCEVFASFDPSEIDLSRTGGAGPRIFKRFLDYAKNGQLEESSATGLDADSPFEEDVADVVRSFGFLADPQVGSAGFRIDVGVRHPDKPGTYVLAVECDGATYHSALWARERDRLRQDVLERLGWRFHRIWSTDWFYNRSAEIERLREALYSARDAAEGGIRVDGANGGRASTEVCALESAVCEIAEPATRQMPAYQRATVPVRGVQEPHEVAVSILAGLAARIVAIDGPVHVEEVARRIASSFGKDKAGSRIIAAAQSALLHAKAGRDDLRVDEEFWFTHEQEVVVPVRDRSAESGATLKAANISMLEIRGALRIAINDNAGGSEADLVRTAARLLGYRRVGAELQARIVKGLELLSVT